MTFLKKSKTSLPAIFVITLIALSILGFSYAHWSTYLYMNGTVSTGIVDWGYTGVTCLDGGSDWHSRDGFAGPAPYMWEDPELKDIGSCKCGLVDTDGDGDFDIVTLMLDKVYPSYFVSVNVYTVNTGTIPIKIDGIVVHTPAGDIIIREDLGPITLDLDNDGQPDIDFWWKNNFGYQIHPGQDGPEISFWIHILQTAHPNWQYNLNIDFIAVAWNEYIEP